jgi:DNA-binding response OmpR family regulator
MKGNGLYIAPAEPEEARSGGSGQYRKSGSGQYHQGEWTSSARRILIADPSGTLSDELEPLLAGERLEVAIAKDGQEAWKNVVAESPELIISDTDLPAMNGLDFCRAVRKSSWLGRTPFVLIADQAHPRMLALATECGADLCLLKPVDPVRLAALVRALLK